MRWVALVAAITMLVACAAEPVRTVALDGERWEVLLAGADGMRGRADFGGADGMLFDLDQDVDPDAVVFVMDGVAFPLDIAWFRSDGVLVGTASMPVCSAQPCPRHSAPGRFRWAIEAPPGAFVDLPAGARLDASPD